MYIWKIKIKVDEKYVECFRGTDKETQFIWDLLGHDSSYKLYDSQDVCIDRKIKK